MATEECQVLNTSNSVEESSSSSSSSNNEPTASGFFAKSKSKSNSPPAENENNGLKNKSCAPKRPVRAKRPPSRYCAVEQVGKKVRGQKRPANAAAGACGPSSKKNRKISRKGKKEAGGKGCGEKGESKRKMRRSRSRRSRRSPSSCSPRRSRRSRRSPSSCSSRRSRSRRSPSQRRSRRSRSRSPRCASKPPRIVVSFLNTLQKLDKDGKKNGMDVVAKASSAAWAVLNFNQKKKFATNFVKKFKSLTSGGK